jgi:hypothetical protein
MAKLIETSFTDFFSGYKRCNQCRGMIHVFPSELKNLGIIPEYHAWILPPHIPENQLHDALSFHVYRYEGWIAFRSEWAMKDWYQYNKELL